MEYLGANISKRYVHGTGVDTPLVSYTGSGVGTSRQFLHKNHQGSVIAISDNSGNVIAKNTYDAYGVPGPNNQGRFGYTGQMYLAELKLYHYRARAYDPDRGRFLQVDPIGYVDQVNLYAYVKNDPLNHTDPSGMCFRMTSGIGAVCPGQGLISSMKNKQGSTQESSSQKSSSQGDANQGERGRNKGNNLTREPGVTGGELANALKDRVSVTAGGRGGVGPAGSLTTSANSKELSDTGSVTVSPGGGEGYGLSGSLTVDLRVFDVGPVVHSPLVDTFEICGGAGPGLCGNATFLDGSVMSVTISGGIVGGFSVTNTLSHPIRVKVFPDFP